MQKALLLLVDDIPANIVALEAVLRSPRYEIQSATSGKEAVRLCAQNEYALIVLDVQMPQMDGYETARQIKELDTNRDTPIVFVTATYQDDPFVKKGFDAGAVDFFGKPFDPDILKTKIGIYTDLYLKSKRLRETEKLLKTHSQIKSLIEALPVGIIIADATGRLYDFNEEARRIWGGERNVDLSQYGIFKGWHGDTGKEIRADEWPMAKALRKGEISKYEVFEIEGFDGNRRTVAHTSYPIRAADGSIVGAFVVLQDLTTKYAVAVDIERKARDLLRDVQLLNLPKSAS